MRGKCITQQTVYSIIFFTAHLPKGELSMTYKELKQKLFDATQILMELYQDIAARAEPFTLTCNSEVKKSLPITS